MSDNRISARFGNLDDPKTYFQAPEPIPGYTLPEAPSKPSPGRKKSATPDIIDNYSAELLCDLLCEHNGDLNLWLAYFNVDKSKHKALMTRAYLILSEPGNEVSRDRWQRILQSFKEAQIALVERAALDTLRDVPELRMKDKDGNWVPLPMKDYAQLYNLVAGDVKAVGLQRAKREDKTTDSTTLSAAKTVEQLERAKARGRNEA